MNHNLLSDRAAKFVQLAIEAGGKIMEIYATDFVAQIKSDQSPVTLADEQAEAIITNGLKRYWPKIPIIAEEDAAAGQIPQVQNQFFLVDPLDGTKEFLSRNGEFTVNIALIENGVPVLGVVYAPALHHIYFGEHGNGSFHASTKNSKLQCRHANRIAHPQPSLLNLAPL